MEVGLQCQEGKNHVTSLSTACQKDWFIHSPIYSLYINCLLVVKHCELDNDTDIKHSLSYRRICPSDQFAIREIKYDQACDSRDRFPLAVW